MIVFPLNEMAAIAPNVPQWTPYIEPNASAASPKIGISYFLLLEVFHPF
jgi:hypothetical protein